MTRWLFFTITLSHYNIKKCVDTTNMGGRTYPVRYYPVAIRLRDREGRAILCIALFPLEWGLFGRNTRSAIQGTSSRDCANPSTTEKTTSGVGDAAQLCIKDIVVSKISDFICIFAIFVVTLHVFNAFCEENTKQ